MSDEVRTTSSSGGEKGVKIYRYDLIPPKPLQDLALLYGRGAEKYAERNWEKGYEWSKSYGALQRHINQFYMGEDYDAETRVLHPINAAFHCFALAEWFTTHPEFDDRPIDVASRNRRKLERLVGR